MVHRKRHQAKHGSSGHNFLRHFSRHKKPNTDVCSKSSHSKKQVSIDTSEQHNAICDYTATQLGLGTSTNNGNASYEVQSFHANKETTKGLPTYTAKQLENTSDKNTVSSGNTIFTAQGNNAITCTADIINKCIVITYPNNVSVTVKLHPRLCMDVQCSDVDTMSSISLKGRKHPLFREMEGIFTGIQFNAETMQTQLDNIVASLSYTNICSIVRLIKNNNSEYNDKTPREEYSLFAECTNPQCLTLSDKIHKSLDTGCDEDVKNRCNSLVKHFSHILPDILFSTIKNKSASSIVNNFLDICVLLDNIGFEYWEKDSKDCGVISGDAPYVLYVKPMLKEMKQMLVTYYKKKLPEEYNVLLDYFKVADIVAIGTSFGDKVSKEGRQIKIRGLSKTTLEEENIFIFLNAGLQEKRFTMPVRTERERIKKKVSSGGFKSFVVYQVDGASNFPGEVRIKNVKEFDKQFLKKIRAMHAVKQKVTQESTEKGDMLLLPYCSSMPNAKSGMRLLMDVGVPVDDIHCTKDDSIQKITPILRDRMIALDVLHNNSYFIVDTKFSNTVLLPKTKRYATIDIEGCKKNTLSNVNTYHVILQDKTLLKKVPIERSGRLLDYRSICINMFNNIEKSEIKQILQQKSNTTSKSIMKHYEDNSIHVDAIPQSAKEEIIKFFENKITMYELDMILTLIFEPSSIIRLINGAHVIRGILNKLLA